MTEIMLTTLFFNSFRELKAKQKITVHNGRPMHNAEALRIFVLFKSLLKFVVADKTVPPISALCMAANR